MPTTTFTTLASKHPVKTQCAHCSSIWDWNLDASQTPTCPVCGYTDPTYGQWFAEAVAAATTAQVAAAYSPIGHTHLPGLHPDLAVHDALGLATDSELATHAGTAHGTQAHAISGVMHSGTLDHSALANQTANQHHNQAHAVSGGDHSGTLVIGQIPTGQTGSTVPLGNDARFSDARTPLTHSHVDADIPAAIARDAEVAAAYSVLGHTHAGGSVDIKEAEIDFGTFPRRSLKATVTDAGVTPSTQLLAYQSGTAATGRKADENEMEALSVRAVAGSGSFTVYADCLTGRASGKFVIAYLLG